MPCQAPVFLFNSLFVRADETAVKPLAKSALTDTFLPESQRTRLPKVPACDSRNNERSRLEHF